MGPEESGAERPLADGVSLSPGAKLPGDLLRRARDGERDAIEELCRRYVPGLRRWLAGRLPGQAQDSIGSDELLRETIVEALADVDPIDLRADGTLRFGLRQRLLLRIRDGLGSAAPEPLGEGIEAEAPVPSPLEDAIGVEAVERYEAALLRLQPDERQAIVARIEMHCTYEEIALMLGERSAGTARQVVATALLALAEEMGTREARAQEPTGRDAGHRNLGGGS